MSEDVKIVSARITPRPRPMPEGMFDPMPVVFGTTATGEEVRLFEYYPDELSFTPAEFVGLTIDQARELKRRKDSAYLRS